MPTQCLMSAEKDICSQGVKYFMSCRSKRKSEGEMKRRSLGFKSDLKERKWTFQRVGWELL